MKHILMFAMILSLFILLVSETYAKIDQKLVVGMWLFEEGSGNTAVDTTGKGNDGAIAGPKKWVQGKFGKGLQFDGSSVWVDIPFNDSLALPELTIVAWGNIKSAKGSRWQSIMGRGQDPRNYLLVIDKDTQKLQLSITKGAAGAWGGPIDGPEVTDGEWHHFAGLVGQKAGLTIYFDGLKVGSQAYSKPSLDANPGNIRIGDNSGGGHQLEGVLDEVALFSVALEETDIKDIMDNGLESATGMKFAVEPNGKLATIWGQIK